jgi:hypothetical protein
MPSSSLFVVACSCARSSSYLHYSYSYILNDKYNACCNYILNDKYNIHHIFLVCFLFSIYHRLLPAVLAPAVTLLEVDIS